MTAASTKWSYRTVDVVAIATLGVAFGVVFWGWGKLYAAPQVAGVLVWPPTAGLWGGGWLIAGIVGGLIVRKPGAALATEYQRLAGPALSYVVQLEPDGDLRWVDGTTQPPRILDQEPDASLGRRVAARVLGWLPIESQL